MKSVESMAGSTSAVDRTWKRATTMVAAATGALAFAGAIGLVGGGADLGATIDRRLPGESPVMAGVALACVVGVPTASAAYAVWRSKLEAAVLTLVAGVLLVAWIALQIVVIREFNVLQVVFGIIGFFLVSAGWHLASAETSKDHSTVR